MRKISFIGSGNVATQMAIALDREGYVIHQIISRNQEHAFDLAKKFGAYSSNNIGDLYEDADLLIIAVSDDEIAHIGGKLNLSKTIVVHTSGSTPMDVLSSSQNYGVLYPLQSLSKSKQADFRKIPLLIEASKKEVLLSLDKVAFSISNRVEQMDSERRRRLHLAAVMVNNFTNYLNTLAEDYLGRNDIPFDLLVPLIKETAERLETLPPSQSQTGPARRGDEKTIQRHLDMLEDNRELQDLYRVFTESIRNRYNS